MDCFRIVLKNIGMTIVVFGTIVAAIVVVGLCAWATCMLFWKDGDAALAVGLPGFLMLYAALAFGIIMGVAECQRGRP